MKAKYIVLFLSVFTISLVASLSMDLRFNHEQELSNKQPYDFQKDTKVHLGIYFSEKDGNTLVIKGFSQSSFGLKKMDKIVSWNGNRNPSFNEVVNLSSKHNIIEVIVKRKGDFFKYKIPSMI